MQLHPHAAGGTSNISSKYNIKEYFGFKHFNFESLLNYLRGYNICMFCISGHDNVSAL